MSWSKQRSFIGKTGANDAMATDATLTEVDGIKDKSSSLSTSEGDKLSMYATGHELVDEEVAEGDYEVTFRVIEPEDTLLTLLGLGSADGEGGDFSVTTHIVEGFWSLLLVPKNIGAKGIKAPKCKISYTPGYSEEDGHYADLKFKVIKGVGGTWYKRFTTKASSIPSAGS